MLGAQGALLGTQFYCTMEALGDKDAKRRIVEARGDHTRRTCVFDSARGYHWPDGYTGRALHNAFMDHWEGHEQDLADSTVARDAFRAAVAARDYDTAMVWAGECVDLIGGVETAAAVLVRISHEAEVLLRTAPTAFPPHNKSMAVVHRTPCVKPMLCFSVPAQQRRAYTPMSPATG